MAHITETNNKWRAQVAKRGVRRSKVFKTYAEAEAWAADQERRIDGMLGRLISPVEAKKHDLPLLTAMPLTVLEAIRKVPHGIYDVLMASVQVGKNEGIYFLIRNQEVVYVGQSMNVLGRLAAHMKEGRRFDAYAIIQAPKEKHDELERMYIRAFVPMYNTSLGNGFFPRQRQVDVGVADFSA